MAVLLNRGGGLDDINTRPGRSPQRTTGSGQPCAGPKGFASDLSTDLCPVMRVNCERTWRS